MKIRLATEKDLEALNNMYQDIVKAMNDNNIGIWNEYYPFEVLPDDIQNKMLKEARDRLLPKLMSGEIEV